MDHKHNGSLPDPDNSNESSTDSRREFLKMAAKGATVAPAVALLMATGSKPAAADMYNDDGGGGCGCGSILVD